MSPRAAARLAWGLWAVSITLLALFLLLLLLNRSTPGRPSFDFSEIAFGVVFVTFGTLGAVIAARRPENTVGWLMCWVGFSVLAEFSAKQYATYTLLTQPGSLPLGEWMAWVDGWFIALTLGSVFVFLPLLFPDGRLPSHRWRPVAWLAVAAILLLTFSEVLKPDPHYDFPSLVNPLGVEAAEGALDAMNEIGFFLMIGTGLAAVLSTILRLHRASGEERQQLKWFAYAMAIVGISVPPLFITWHPAAAVVFAAGVAGVPVAIGVAMLRYRLYDIDRIINRTLVYGLLTGGLGGAYFGLVVGLQALFEPVTGGSGLAIAFTTLVVAALFLPARLRIQDAVDRRFNRRAYDAGRTIQAFSARLREQIDLDTLRQELLAVVDETMQPTAASLWLRELEARR